MTKILENDIFFQVQHSTQLTLSWLAQNLKETNHYALKYLKMTVFFLSMSTPLCQTWAESLIFSFIWRCKVDEWKIKLVYWAWYIRLKSSVYVLKLRKLTIAFSSSSQNRTRKSQGSGLLRFCFCLSIH